MPLRKFYELGKSNGEEGNTMMDSPAAVNGMYDPISSIRDSSNKSVLVSGLCQSLKNVNQYRSGMIEKIKDQLGSHSIYLRKKQ
jgi:hypothetical protein